MSKEKAAGEPAGKSKKLIIIIAAAVLVLGGGVGGWLFMKKGKAEGDAEAKAEKAAAPAAAQYYKFDPAFVVNFGGPDNSRFLQITAEAMSRDPLVLDLLKGNEPAIRNSLLLLFSSQQYEVLMSAEGKEALRQSTTEAIRKVLAKEGAKPDAIEDVFFTSFVIQ
jgi:flagellar protein FliL